MAIERYTELPDYALSVKQPWCWAILAAGKTYENRVVKTPFRGRLLLHAGINYDWAGHRWLLRRGFQIPPNLPIGCYLGMVDMLGCYPHGSEPVDNMWAFGPYCWRLANPEPLSEPIPARGYVGIYEWRPHFDRSAPVPRNAPRVCRARNL